MFRTVADETTNCHLSYFLEMPSPSASWSRFSATSSVTRSCFGCLTLSDEDTVDVEALGPQPAYRPAYFHESAAVSPRSRRRAEKKAEKEAARALRKESKREQKAAKREHKAAKRSSKAEKASARPERIRSKEKPVIVSRGNSSSSTEKKNSRRDKKTKKATKRSVSSESHRVVIVSPPKTTTKPEVHLDVPDVASVASGSRRGSVVRFDETSDQRESSSEGARSEWKWELKRKESRRRKSTAQGDVCVPNYGDLFAELHKGGEKLTQNLKHVSKDEKKRRRAASKSGPASNKTFGRTKTLAPIDFAPLVEPVDARMVELVHGREWRIENIREEKEIVEIYPTKIMETVLIRNCEDCTIRINKKVNSIIVENCRVVNVIADSLIASFEIIRCQKLQTQVMNSCLCYTLDGVDGCTIFLSEAGREAQIVASKISEVNVSFPSKDDPEDFVKVPIPEQFVYTINEKDKVDSRVSDLYG